MSDKICQTTDETFVHDVLESKEPVLVDFWAEWCGPCRMISLTLDELAEEISSVKIVKMNIDDNVETPARFGVRSIPTLALFKDGKALSTKVGLVSKEKLKEWIEASLA